jgi:hypothetical protein
MANWFALFLGCAKRPLMKARAALYVFHCAKSGGMVRGHAGVAVMRRGKFHYRPE